MTNNSFAFLCVTLLFVGCVLQQQFAGATLCKPLSSFKIDCNTCFCGVDGARYACTDKICKQPPVRFDDNDLVIPRNPQYGSKEIPYLNDEIPASRDEEWNDLLLGREEDEAKADEYALPLTNDVVQEDDVDEYRRFDNLPPAAYGRHIFI